MSRFDALKQQFASPPAEFTPIPFWFWNDELTRDEILRQLRDFHAKEVDGFVIHPRMGLPRSMPYLSDAYMDLVELAVSEAHRLGMKVILYDEGMYPSGSANGLVVKENPDYASRGLQMREYPCGLEGAVVPVTLEAGERLVSVQAVRKLGEREIDPASTVVLDVDGDGVRFVPPPYGDWSVLLFVDTYSKGTIRGVHPGQDDGEPDAPAAADLLNPEAVRAFIRLTHEVYYRRLKDYFGSTVIAMFTDEPDLLGRGHVQGLMPWTGGFLDEWLAQGADVKDLPALWFEAGAGTERIRARFREAIRSRLSRTYYKALSDWCEAHGIGLTGHPAASQDIGLLEHFHIPGQDVVWRYIGPEGDKALTGPHSTMGKCSSDAARHRGRPRNLNECFGVCGLEGGWSLTADDMKWYLDWLFVRGVNMISPHAFYYSIRGERRDERPPDVGPNNIWWSEYAQFSRYIRRMSWLMTDSRNGAEVAVLAGADYLPWRIVRPLYEHQIEFNYLEEALLLDGSVAMRDGALEIAGYRYRAVLVEEGWRLSAESRRLLQAYVGQGGMVVELSGGTGGSVPDIGQRWVRDEAQVPSLLAAELGRAVTLTPACASLRVSRLSKDGIRFYVVVNEGEEAYEGELEIRESGAIECWEPWTGRMTLAYSRQTADGQRIALRVERRECLVLAADPGRAPADAARQPRERKLLQELPSGWRVVDGPWTGELARLSSWTEWAGLEHYSGTITYEREFELGQVGESGGQVLLDLGEAHEMTRLWVNGEEIGVRMWKPYIYDISRAVRSGSNVVRVAVTNSLANAYDGKSFPSGLNGPVTLWVM